MSRPSSSARRGSVAKSGLNRRTYRASSRPLTNVSRTPLTGSRQVPSRLQQAQRLQRLDVFGRDHLAANDDRLSAHELAINRLDGCLGRLARRLCGRLVVEAVGGDEVGHQGGDHSHLRLGQVDAHARGH